MPYVLNFSSKDRMLLTLNSAEANPFSMIESPGYHLFKEIPSKH